MSPVRIAARRLAMRCAAAIRKWPDPHEQRFVDGSELFRAEVAVVDWSEHLFVFVLDETHTSYCGKKVLIGDVGLDEIRARGIGP